VIDLECGEVQGSLSLLPSLEFVQNSWLTGAGEGGAVFIFAQFCGRGGGVWLPLE